MLKRIELENLHKEIFYIINEKGSSSPKKHGEYKTYKIKDYTFIADTWNQNIDIIIGEGGNKKEVWLGDCWGGYTRNVSEIMLMYYCLIITEQEIPYMFFDKED